MIAFPRTESIGYGKREQKVPRAKNITIGCRGDALAMKHLERACIALREAHPNGIFLPEFDAPSKVFEERRQQETCARASALTGRTFSVSLRKAESRRSSASLLQRVSHGEVDACIMDARWVPMQLAPPLDVVAVLERTNPYDVLISSGETILDEQPENARIAVIDAVKRGQLLYYRPDLEIIDFEDDFDRLFDSLNKGTISAFVYPAADVEMLNKQEHVVEVFTTSICTPPSGQGAQVLIARRDRKDVCSLLRDLNDPSSAAEIELERMLLGKLSRDGRGPIGTLGSVESNSFELEAAIASPDGSERIFSSIGGSLSEKSKVVAKLASELLAAGADEIISSYRRIRGNV